jgi:DNA (cytosine-5)-methyltransferase 1
MPTPRAYYNEFDVKAAAWLRELIKAGHIAPGDVDDRSIKDVAAADLKGYTQCHFFAGIGGWSYALRLAGWPDDRPVWTGSCPCQPFSMAGQRGGTDDPRHLWPEFYRLIGFGRPSTIFGEQVASKDGLAWLDIVCADMERADYAIGAADMCAAGVGAPHIRQRLYFVGDTASARSLPGAHARIHSSQESVGSWDGESKRPCTVSQLAFSEGQQHDGRGNARTGRRQSTNGCDLGDALRERQQERGVQLWGVEHGRQALQHQSEIAGTSSHNELEYASCDGRQQRRPESGERGIECGRRQSAWDNVEFIPCTDGKARPIESGTFPLAHGVPHRVGLLRGYGNAIVPQVAAEFIGAYLDIAG